MYILLVFLAHSYGKNFKQASRSQFPQMPSWYETRLDKHLVTSWFNFCLIKYLSGLSMYLQFVGGYILDSLGTFLEDYGMLKKAK